MIVLDGVSPRSEAYDEGRVSERLMLAAADSGSAAAPPGSARPRAQGQVRGLLGIPADRIVWSAVGFGYVDTAAPQRASTAVAGGRKPLTEMVS